MLTEPTSIQIESLLNYSGLSVLAPYHASVSDFIFLVDEMENPYKDTAFGYMDGVLHNRTAMPVFDF
jgi:hypothetical protein